MVRMIKLGHLLSKLGYYYYKGHLIATHGMAVSRYIHSRQYIIIARQCM